MENISNRLSGSFAPSGALPAPYSRAEYERYAAQWAENAGRMEDAELAVWMRQAINKPLLQVLFGTSPYISRLALHYPEVLRDMEQFSSDKTYKNIIDAIPSTTQEKDLMRELRIGKGKLALLTAAADISGKWSLGQVTAALSGYAEYSLSRAMDYLLDAAHKIGEIALPNPMHPSQGCGIAILGMGKLGGRELNYSSDIDLMIFFERGRLNYKGRHDEQHFMNRIAHDLVNIMQERTPQGYVFRTDLRLRPDPASTPPAINTDAAYHYYESVGQNWERAAMIKARPVAGDIAAGEKFLKSIGPFMWRRNLDFASINDIHSIKRQMDTRQNKDIRIKGHNIKLGLGGIREIEFYAQIHQLIWGGRNPSLRLRGTCETLSELMKKELVDIGKGAVMQEAYVYLRTLEHRLQMISDEQTHTVPENDGELARVSCFMGYGTVDAFTRALLMHLQAVHTIYASSFQSAERLGEEGNLVFTGVNHDPETLETLRHMGYANPETVSEVIMGWHHGSKRATRSQRARELLTELMPALLKRLSETASPDTAFIKFNDFLSNLPAGVQIFSLFNLNRHLLGLIADIMGSAPTLAEHLSKSPALLDAVLSADFYGPLPSREQIAGQIQQALLPERGFEERMDAITRSRNEKQFQAGVQFLRHMIDARQMGAFMSDLADAAIHATYEAVYTEFAQSYGKIAGSSFAVIGLGKLGSRELTFGSDIDLVLVYDAPDAEALSDGEKNFTAGVYYNRFAQRFLSALTVMSTHGRLYEVDTRLRPSGKQGALVASMQGLDNYFRELAWTFEYMAFSKARVVAGDKRLYEPLHNFIEKLLTQPRDAKKLCADASDMRERIHKEFGTDNPWDIKYVRGGSIDIDFIAQYLLLKHAPVTPGVAPGSATQTLAWLKDAGCLRAGDADALLKADGFLGQIFHMLRLCSGSAFEEASAPEGLKKLLCESVGEKDFTALKRRLLKIEAQTYALYNTLLR